MKKYLTGKISLFILLLPLMFVACNKNMPTTKGTDTLTVYFSDFVRGSLFAETVPIDLKQVATEIDRTQFVIDALIRGPQSTTLQTNASMPIENSFLDKNTAGEQVAYVVFDERYKALSTQEQIGIRSSIVYSLTELDFIKAVEFFIEDTPLLNINEKPVGAIAREDIIMHVLNPNPPTTIQAVALYFGTEDNKYLAKERRDLLVNRNVALERYIVAELIKGPEQEGLISTIPKETIINDINTKEGICQVDLSFDIKSKHFAAPESKKLMIYSIVNSLTELPGIDKVAFLIDGKKEVAFSKDIDLSEFFEREEALVVKEELYEEY